MVLYNNTTQHIANDGSQMQYQLSIVPNGDISYMFCDKPSELIIMIVVMMRMRRIRW